jgi:hypothetical protein
VAGHYADGVTALGASAAANALHYAATAAADDGAAATGCSHVGTVVAARPQPASTKFTTTIA